MGLITLCRNYLRWTQAVVVAPLIARAKRNWLKVAWSLVLVAITVTFVVQSYYLFANHLAYKTNTNTRLIHDTEAPFPAITFCSLNPFKKSMVDQSQELKNLVATYMYVVKVKQAQLKSGFTADAGTTSPGSETHTRGKRQAQNDNAVVSITSSFTPTTAPKTTTLGTTVESTTTMSPSSSATRETKKTSSTSMLGTTDAQLTSTPELPTTMPGGSTTTNDAETTTSESTPLTCQETPYSYNTSSSTYSYSVWNCSDETAFVEFGDCNASNTLRTKLLPTSDVLNGKNDMAAFFYECLHHVCTAGGCERYPDGLNAVLANKNCLKDGPTSLDRVGFVVHALANHCNYSDASCSFEMGRRSPLSGYYYRRECSNVITTVFEDCNSPSASYAFSSKDHYYCQRDRYGYYVDCWPGQQCMDSDPADPIWDFGRVDQSVNHHAREHCCYTVVDNRTTDDNDRNVNDQCCGSYHNQGYDDNNHAVNNVFAIDKLNENFDGNYNGCYLRYV